jgi:hypothetical protein
MIVTLLIGFLALFIGVFILLPIAISFLILFCLTMACMKDVIEEKKDLFSKKNTSLELRGNNFIISYFVVIKDDGTIERCQN